MGRILVYGKHSAVSAGSHAAVRTGKHQAVACAGHARAGVSVSYATVLRRAALVLAVPVLAFVACLLTATIQNSMGHATGATAAKVASQTQFVNSSSTPTKASSSESFILETSASRNVESALAQVQGEEEEMRVAAEQAARAAEAQAIKQAQEAQSRTSATAVGLVNVDFTVGREAFLAEWTERINTYLEGTPLAGYGADFAGAAWEYGVDPRWSPAISCTESTKGVYLAAAHNAWGWTGGSWSDWTSAIYAHVAGLAKGYGHTITYANAARYCPPNTAHWYRTTLSEMAKI